MKRMYKAPETIVVALRLQSMIAGTNDGRNVSSNSTSGANQLSRDRGSDWDDEDDW